MSDWPDATSVEELFLARETEFAFHGARLRFQLARSLFSSAGIDPGSALLLRHVQALGLPGAERVLDVGSGCGVLGLVLQALDNQRHIVSVDRDALACRYTRRNLDLNELAKDQHLIEGSLGYDAVVVHDPFDLIVSNIPGKAGAPFIDHLVDGAAAVATAGAVLAVVVVKPLESLVADAFDRNDLDVALMKGNKTHQVLIARLGNVPAGSALPNGFEAGIYDRGQTTFASGSASWKARTVIGLGEFDTLSYPTRLLRSALGGVPAGPSVVVNPGQGHRAVIAARAGYVPAVVLSRDRLALHATRRVLVEGGDPAPGLVHDVTVDALGDRSPHRLIISHADDKVYAPWFFDQVKRCLDRLQNVEADGPRDLVLTGRASLLGRLEAEVLRRRKGHIAYKESQRGCRSVRFRLT